VNSCYQSVQTLLFSSLLSKNIKIKIHRPIILPVVLYACQTWSLTSREEYKLRISVNRMLRTIFWRRGDEVAREWRRLRNEELCGLYSSPDIIRVNKSRRMTSAGCLAHMGQRRGSYRVSVGRSERKNHLQDRSIDGRMIMRWIFNKWAGEAGTRLIWFRDRWRALVNTVTNLRVP